MAVRTKAQKAAQQDARERLRAIIKPGQEVYTCLRHVSRSGMSRDISVHVVEDGQVRWITGLVALALDIPRASNNTDALKVGGCGMDMGFHVVYELGYALFGAGFGCIGERCPSNDHSNGDRDYTPHDDGTPRTTEEVGTDIPGNRAHRHWHKDGGYALRHRWI